MDKYSVILDANFKIRMDEVVADSSEDAINKAIEYLNDEPMDEWDIVTESFNRDEAITTITTHDVDEDGEPLPEEEEEEDEAPK